MNISSEDAIMARVRNSRQHGSSRGSQGGGRWLGRAIMTSAIAIAAALLPVDQYAAFADCETTIVPRLASPTTNNPNPSNVLSGGCPVDHYYGTKFEQATDIVVMLPGSDFRVTRAYSSIEPNNSPNSIMGKGWNANFISALGLSTNANFARLFEGATNFPIYRGSGNTAHQAGDPDQHAMSTTREDTVDGSATYRSWKLMKPGSWTRFYHRNTAAWMPDIDSGGYDAIPDTSLEGLLWKEIDANGVTREYTWESVESSVFTSSCNRTATRSMSPTGETNAKLPVVTQIDFYAGTTVIAKIEIDWFLPSGAYTAMVVEQPYIHTIRVMRPDGMSGFIETQRAEYLYSLGSLGSCGRNDYFGALEQVKVFTRMDGDSGSDLSRVRITQYRYGDGDSQNGDDDGLMLTHVFMPEGVELYMENIAIAGWTPSGSDTEIEQAAALLLGSTSPTLPGGYTKEDFAAKIMEYDAVSGVIASQEIQSSCGCAGGGSTQSVRREYELIEYTGANAGVRVMIETEFTGGPGAWTEYRYRIYEYRRLGENDTGRDDQQKVPYLMREALLEPKPDGSGGFEPDNTRAWVTTYGYIDGVGYDINEGLKIREYSPAVHQSYTVPSSSTAPNFGTSGIYPQIGQEYGLAYNTEYDSSQKVVHRSIDGHLVLTSSDFAIEDVEYGDGMSSENPSRLPETVTRYRVDTTNNPPSASADDVEVTSYRYGFHGNDPENEERYAWIETSVEAELTSELGPGGTYTSYEIYDEFGNNTWSVAADGSVTKREFDTSTGQMTAIEYNADAAGIPTGGDYAGLPSFSGRHADGDSLRTEFTLDELGRVIEIKKPGGVTNYIVRQMMVDDEREDLEYYAEIMLPHVVAVNKYDGPAVVTWMNAEDDLTRRGSYKPNGFAGNRSSFSSSIASSPGTALTEEHLKHVIDHNIVGQIESEERWHDVSGNGSYLTQYTYDIVGRKASETNPNGTVREYDYDILDRVTEIRIGTTSTSGTLPTLVEYEYDGGDAFGNSNLTKITEYPSDTSGQERETVMVYDWRDRLIERQSPESPHTFYVYDNLNRVVQEALYADKAYPPTLTSGVVGFHSSEVSPKLTRTMYSQRGLPYTRQVAIDPLAGTVVYLESQTWYDEVGRPVQQWDPNEPATKIEYDGLGRQTGMYVTDRGGDSVYADVHNASSHTAVVSGDTIFEQMSYSYIEGRWDRGEGLVDIETTHRRSHDATITGSLDGRIGAEAKQVITTYATKYYDTGNRLIRSVDLGTGQTGFSYGGTVTTPDQSQPPTVAPSNGALLVNAYVYDDYRGLPYLAFDPDAVATQTFYDDLNRPIAIAENVLNADVEWSTSFTPHRWKATGLDTADTDRVTSFVYDGLNNIVVRTAHGSTSGDTDAQVTQYVYGVTNTTGGSELDSNDLLAEAIYPDESTGSPGASAVYKVTYRYNRVGELVGMTDQNSTIHDYTRDKHGRVTLDLADIDSGSGIDDWADSIEYDYDDYDRLEYVTTLDGSTIKNQIRYIYDSLWRVATMRQNPVDDAANADPMTGNTFYQFTDEHAGLTSAAKNIARVRQMSYPMALGTVRTKVAYGYGSTNNDVDDVVSRMTGMSWDGAGGLHTTYDNFVGFGMRAISGRNGGDLVLDRFTDPSADIPDNTDTENGVYPGFDRYGRVARQVWHTESVGTWDPDDTPAFYDLSYDYSNASDVLSRNDFRARGLTSRDDTSEAYTYDGLHRLTESERGIYDPSGPTFTVGGGGALSESSQRWDLDILGNWDQFDVDTLGTGAYSTSESRVHNMANEFTGVTGSSEPRTYDDAGNLIGKTTVSGGERRFTYDAWNRLVEVEFYVTYTDGMQVVSEYQTRLRNSYYGQHQRATSVADTTLDGDADERNHFYYDTQWRLLERRLDDQYNGAFEGPATSFDREAVHQYIWGDEYLDELCFFQKTPSSSTTDFTGGECYFALTDRNYSVIGMYNAYDPLQSSTGGQIVDRIRYSAYGQPFTEPLGDVDGDGDKDGDDLSAVTSYYGSLNASSTSYVPEADYDFDGDVDFGDVTAVNGFASITAGEDVVSTVGCIVGYTGHVYDAGVQLHLARHRWLDSADGGWLARDPIEYDGSAYSQYEYVASSPYRYRDQYGLTASASSIPTYLPPGVVPGTSPIPALPGWITKPAKVIGKRPVAACLVLGAIVICYEYAEDRLQRPSSDGIRRNRYCRKLYSNYKKLCDVTGCTGGGARGHSCLGLSAKVARFMACAAKRLEYRSNCVAGFARDGGHDKAIQDALKAAHNCQKCMVKKKCWPFNDGTREQDIPFPTL